MACLHVFFALLKSRILRSQAFFSLGITFKKVFVMSLFGILGIYPSQPDLGNFISVNYLVGWRCSAGVRCWGYDFTIAIFPTCQIFSQSWIRVSRAKIFNIFSSTSTVICLLRSLATQRFFLLFSVPTTFGNIEFVHGSGLRLFLLSCHSILPVIFFLDVSISHLLFSSIKSIFILRVLWWSAPKQVCTSSNTRCVRTRIVSQVYGSSVQND